MQKHPRMKVVGNRLRWAGHVQEMGEETLTKRTWKHKRVVEGEEADQKKDGGTVSRDILKWQR